MSLTPQAYQDIMLGKDGTYDPNARDVLKQHIWDSRYFATTISDHTYFTQPISSPWRVGLKSENETNLVDSGKLPAGQTFLAKKMHVRCITFAALTETVPEDLIQAFYNILHSSYFNIKIASREFETQIHGTQFTPSIAISGSIATAHVRCGDTIASGTVNLEPTPIFIGSLISFSVKQVLNNPDTGVVTILNACATALNTAKSVMQVILEGTLTRAK